MPPAILALGAVAIPLAGLYLAFEPFWETNDDVAMSMVAHGYGLATYGSPHLIFSSVVWGHLVRIIPSIGDVSGYGVATVVCLAAIGWSTLYFLNRIGTPFVVAWLAVALLLLRPTLFPQFTITAGLLTVAAILSWRTYARVGNLGTLIVACVLTFAGYLIRQQEFILVLFVGVPLIPWRALLRQGWTPIAVVLLGATFVAAFAVDRWSYQGEEWTAFSDLNGPRRQFTDFEASERLLGRPEVMARYGYSENDVRLIGNWFFVDPTIAAPAALNAILAELGPVPLQRGSILSGLRAIEALAAPELLPLLIPALVLLVAMRDRSVVVTWVLSLAALFTIGLFGRPGILRVYVPLVTLLLVGPLIVGQWRGTQRRIAACTLLVASLVNAYMLIPDASDSARRIQRVQRDLLLLPQEPIVIWGGGFPFEAAFPPFSGGSAARAPHLYGLGVFTLAPFSVASMEEAAGGIIESLRSNAGVPVIASPDRIELLRTYCAERLHGELHEIANDHTSSFVIQRLQCRAATGEPSTESRTDRSRS